MNFEELEIRLRELYDIKIYTDNSQNKNYKPVIAEFNEVFLNFVKASVTEKKFFSGSPLDLFKIALKEKTEIFKQEEIDFDENEYITKIYLQQYKLLSSGSPFTYNDPYYYTSYLNNENRNLFRSIIKKRVNYIEKLLYEKGIEVIKTKDNPIPELGWNGKMKISFKRNLKIIIENENKKTVQTTKTATSKHENIFCNNGFELFDHILKECIKPKGVKGRQSDLIFYYWKMYNNKPQFIHQRPTEFFTWFDKKYSETSGQLKTYDNVKTTPKEKDFSLALDWFKLQNH